jgi:hypothetical protein
MNPQNSPSSSEPAGETSTDGGVAETSGARSEKKSTLAQTAREATAKMKSAVSGTVARTQEEIEHIAAQKKEQTAGRLGTYSEAIHDSARSLEEKDPNLAWFTHQAADKLQHVADYLRNRDFANFRHDVEDTARRHPAAFFGGLFVAGLILGNVVKASRRNVDTPANPNAPDGDSSGGSWREADEARPADLTESARSAAGI